jgi:hypothetical protein
MTKVVNFYQAQRLTPAEEERLRQRTEQPRPPTKYEQDLERLAKEYLKRKEQKR